MGWTFRLPKGWLWAFVVCRLSNTRWTPHPKRDPPMQTPFRPIILRISLYKEDSAVGPPVFGDAPPLSPPPLLEEWGANSCLAHEPSARRSASDLLGMQPLCPHRSNASFVPQGLAQTSPWKTWVRVKKVPKKAWQMEKWAKPCGRWWFDFHPCQTETHG